MAAQHHALLLIGAMTLACRGEPELPAEGTAVGGGPPARPVLVTPARALESLREARCERVNKCGIIGTGCEHDATALYGPVLRRCERGVRESALGSCARHVRTTPCSSMVAVAEACSVDSLCAP